VRIDPDGAAAIVAQDLWFPNGMMIPDGTLIVAETFATPLTGPSASCPTDRWPTGAPGALDAEGHVGSQRAGAAVCHVAPGGRIDDQVAMPEGLGVFACGLGSKDAR
jgi:sugar lactone lactonase YvrE